MRLNAVKFIRKTIEDEFSKVKDNDNMKEENIKLLIKFCDTGYMTCISNLLDDYSQDIINETLEIIHFLKKIDIEKNIKEVADQNDSLKSVYTKENKFVNHKNEDKVASTNIPKNSDDIINDILKCEDIVAICKIKRNTFNVEPTENKNKLNSLRVPKRKPSVKINILLDHLTNSAKIISQEDENENIFYNQLLSLLDDILINSQLEIKFTDDQHLMDCY